MDQRRAIPAEAAAGTGFGLGAVAGLIGKPFELGQGHRVFAEVEITRENHGARRFIQSAFGLRHGGSLLVGSLGDEEEFETDTSTEIHDQMLFRPPSPRHRGDHRHQQPAFHQPIIRQPARNFKRAEAEKPLQNRIQIVE